MMTAAELAAALERANTPQQARRVMESFSADYDLADPGEKACAWEVWQQAKALMQPQ